MNNEINNSIPPLEFNHIYAALAKAQSHLRSPQKDTSGYGYKYATLSQLTEIIREGIAQFGLGYTQNLQSIQEEAGNFVSVETYIFHESGQRLQSSFFTMPVSVAKGSTIEQNFGKTCTYARRYALAAVFGLAEADTDGKIPAPKPAPAPKPIKMKIEKAEGEKESLKEIALKKVEKLNAGEYIASKGINLADCENKIYRLIIRLTDAELTDSVAAYMKQAEEEAA